MAAPLFAGAVHDRSSSWWRAVALRLVGASGAWAAGVPVAVADQALSPTEFVAATRIVYTVPLVKLPDVGMVSDVVVEVAWRLVLSQSSAPDFHCTL